MSDPQNADSRRVSRASQNATPCDHDGTFSSQSQHFADPTTARFPTLVGWINPKNKKTTMENAADRELEARERFWSRVKKTDSCWLWTRAVNVRGYGKLSYNGKHILAHRLAWILTSGPIPKGLLVCHSCDTPGCVRPDHLFVGTAKDNVDDMWRKGRGRGGLEFVKKLMRHRATLVDDLADLDGRIAKFMNKILKQADGTGERKSEKDGVML